jgi:hypothetical protein
MRGALGYGYRIGGGSIGRTHHPRRAEGDNANDRKRERAGDDCNYAFLS